MKRIISISLILNSIFLYSNIFPFSISMTPTGKIVKWSSSNVSYYLDPDGVDDITDNSDVNAVYSSFSDWQSVACTNLTFKNLGATTNTDVTPVSGYTNGKNELIWIEDSKWKFGKYTLGVTAPVYYYSGAIFEADIAFNGYLMQWSTKGDIYKADVKSVAIHEIGHLFGLGHVLGGYNPYNPPTMAPQADPFLQSQTLEEDDKNGICFLYPKNGVYKCSKDDECPYVIDQNQYGEEFYKAKFNCKNGECALGGVVPAKKKLGEACTSSSECESPYFCQPVQGGKSYCSTYCDPQKQNCPQGFKCYPYSNAPGGACLLDTTQGKKQVGEPCSSSYECITNLCFPNPDKSGMFCRIPCKKGGNDCPEGQSCITIGTSSNGACLSNGQNKKKTGEVCKNDNECESEICFGEGEFLLCREPCNPAEQKCSIGYYCKDLGSGTGACVPGTPPQPQKKQDGALCISNKECKSNLCYNLIGTNLNYCRTDCELSKPYCPSGTICISYGDPHSGVCMPQKNNTGEFCETFDDCTSAICWTDFDGEKYCTAICINGKCEEGYKCATGTILGNLCVKEKTPQSEETDVFQAKDKIDQETTQYEKEQKENGGEGWCNFNLKKKNFNIEFIFILLIFIGVLELRKKEGMWSKKH